MKHLDLFSGIGGFALATEMVWGKEVEHVFCDNDPFAQAVLSKHWPNSKIYGDIRTLTANAESKQTQSAKPKRLHAKSGLSHREHIDILTGGFPCQPFSAAGARRGTEDSRHLWPEMLRVIREFKPRWVIGENVGGLVTWSDGLVLEQIHLDLEAEGYEVQAFIIPAVALNAPHRRDRVWIVAHRTDAERRPRQLIKEIPTVGASRHSQFAGSDSNAANSNTGRIRRHKRTGTQKGTVTRSSASWDQHWPEVATALCRVDDGIPRRLDRTARLKGLGNAIVPQVAAQIMQAIKDNE